jgi:hypothetical protein
MTESNGLTDLVYLRALNDRHVSEAADAIEALEAENEKLRQTLDTVWQDLHTIKSHIQIAIRHKSS